MKKNSWIRGEGFDGKTQNKVWRVGGGFDHGGGLVDGAFDSSVHL